MRLEELFINESGSRRPQLWRPGEAPDHNQTQKYLTSPHYQSFILKMDQLHRWVSPLRLNCSETISHREKSEVGNETLDLGLQDIFMLFCYNLITFDSAAHLKWTNPTEKMALTHLWNETLV